MPDVADVPVYPRDKITPAFVEALQNVYEADGRDAALAQFRTAVADDPWFRQPGTHGDVPVEDMDRTEWEFACLMTGDGEGAW